MLGRLGRRDNDEGLKERLVMLVVEPVFMYSGEAPVGSNFGAGGVFPIRRVTAGTTEGIRMIRRTDPSPCDITSTGL